MPHQRSPWPVLLAAALLISAAVPRPAAADEARHARLRGRFPDNVVRWGGDTEGGAPYQFMDPAKGDLVGFEVDLVDSVVAHLAKQLGLPLNPRFVQYEWVSLPQGLDKRDFDFIASGMEITDRNAEKMIFTRPYYLFAQQLTVRDGESRIRSLDDVRPLRVGTLASSSAYDLLERRGFGNVVGYEGQIEPYQELLNERVDAVLLDVPIAIYNTADKPGFKTVGALEGWGGYGMAVRPDDADLRAAIDDALAELGRTGRIEQVVRKWKLWTEEQRELAKLDSPQALLQWTAQKNGDDRTSGSEWTFSVYAPLLLKAAGVTVGLTFLSMAVAMTIGLFVAVCRLYGPPPVRWLALAYVEFFRGIPLLLLLTFLYYGLPSVGITLSAWQAAIIGFGLNYAAFEAEIYRSSILAVPRGQWEAAQALGMTETTTFRRVVFPQAFRTALGPMTNDFVAMFKDTSLVSVISVVELTKQYQILARTSLKFVEIGALTALLYLAMSVPLGYLARYLEDRWSAGHK